MYEYIYQEVRKSTINGMSPTSSQNTNINTLTNSNIIYKSENYFQLQFQLQTIQFKHITI